MQWKYIDGPLESLSGHKILDTLLATVYFGRCEQEMYDVDHHLPHAHCSKFILEDIFFQKKFLIRFFLVLLELSPCILTTERVLISSYIYCIDIIIQKLQDRSVR